MNRPALRAGGCVAIGVLAAVLVVAGHWLLFSTFQPYDDEGYVLYSLHNYGEHGGLYDQVFSQYGPAFFAFSDALSGLFGFAWTNASGRLLTLAYWLATAGCVAALVWRATRSQSTTAFATSGVFAFIWVMINEPTHPGGPIGCFVALAALVGAVRDPARSAAGAAIVGAIGAGLALTKINVGAFLLFSATAWMAFQVPQVRGRRIAVAAVSAWLLLMPWILMSPKLGEPATLWFAVATNLATAGWVATALRHPVAPGAARRPFIAFLAGATTVTLITAVVTLARGTSPAGLLRGVLLDPLNQPDVFSFAVQWQPAAALVAIAATALAIGASIAPRHGFLFPAICAVRFGAAIAFALAIVQVGPFKSLADFGISYGVALAAVCATVLRPDEEGIRDARLRLWLAALLLLQSLHAYPVAGSQLNWATFLWLPLLALSLRDASIALFRRSGSPTLRRLLSPVGAVTAWVLASFMALNLLDIGWAKRQVGAPLDQPGTEGIRAPDNIAFGLRIMAENATAHGSMLYSMPGLYSLNLWTGIPTPTLDNATQWFLSLSEDRQQAILERMRSDPGAVFVVQRDTLQYLVDHGFRVRGPLGEFLGQSFERAFEVDGYALWVQRGRRVAPLSTGRAQVDSEGNRTRLELVVARPRAPVASIELSNILTVPRTLLANLGPGEASFGMTPLDNSGAVAGGRTPDAWNVEDASPIVRLDAEFEGQLQQAGWVLARLLDADGGELAAVRIIE